MENGRFTSKRIDNVLSCGRQLLLLQLLLFPILSVAEEVATLSWKDAPPADIKVGDVVFRKGTGLWTKYFINVSSREKRFSHVGVVVSNMPTTVILHADANDMTGKGCVRLESWNGFFRNALECAVYRYDGDSSRPLLFVEKGMQKLGVPFDWAFNMSNTNSLYCTELVREIINEVTCTNLVGYTEVCGRRIVAIDDIYRYGFTKIFDSRVSPSASNEKRCVTIFY